MYYVIMSYLLSYVILYPYFTITLHFNYEKEFSTSMANNSTDICINNTNSHLSPKYVLNSCKKPNWQPHLIKIVNTPSIHHTQEDLFYWNNYKDDKVNYEKKVKTVNSINSKSKDWKAKGFKSLLGAKNQRA